MTLLLYYVYNSYYAYSFYNLTRRMEKILYVWKKVIVLLIEIDTLKASPIYEQLRDQVVLGIAGNKLAHGEALPSVRRLAADLGINLHTVNKAYTMLCDEGYIVMDRRRGAVVSPALESGAAFIAELSRKLTMAAAEAKCHKIGRDDFIRLCDDCYKKNIGG